MKYYNPTTKQLTSKPRISGVTNPTEATILANGWLVYEDVKPEFDTGYKVIKSHIDEYGRQQYDIVYIDAPQTCTPAQGKILLKRLNLLSQVEQIVSLDAELLIFWENATIWDRTKPIMKNLANQLNQNIDDFFTEANKIDL